MKDRELNELLKSARTPERPEDYWRNFPRRVTSKLHWQPRAAASAQLRRLDAFLTWGLGLATVCVAVMVVFHQKRSDNGSVASQTPTISTNDEQLAEAKKCYGEFKALFANQLAAVVIDQKGPRMILADKANLPDSTPLYLHVCSASGCVAYVTFSGQRIPVNGESCEVLTDGQDHVMLVGKDHVWSEGNPSGAVQIEAKTL